MIDKAEAEKRGWEFLDHKISAKKDGHVFAGEPEDVFARIERFEEHGDFVRATVEAAQRQDQHESIDSLVSRVTRLANEYGSAWDSYLDSKRPHHSQMRDLERATDLLTKLTDTFRALLEHPQQVLLENERFVQLRNALGAWGG